MGRKLYFLLPGTDGKFACGGLWAELKAFNLARQVCEATVVTYRQREQGTLFLDDVLQQDNLDEIIFVLSWGFHVPKLAARLRHCHVVYHAHSAGYGFRLPTSVPIITVSRNTLGYWGQTMPNALIYYLPNEISNHFQNLNGERDIDVLIQQRKSSSYLMNQLIPALQPECNVVVIDSYVDKLEDLFNRSKVYLYDSAEYWAQSGVSEGFGLQPMEAMACGCQVFSSINGGLSDYLDPGFNCHKIAGYSSDFDVQRILQALQHPSLSTPNEDFFAEYRADSIIKRLAVIVTELNHFFDHKQRCGADIRDLTQLRIAQLKLQKIVRKVRQKIS